MKVLHVGKFFYPHKGGLEFYMRDTLVEFSRRGVECAALVHQHETGAGDADEVFREGGAAIRVVRAGVQFNLLFTPFSRSFRRLLERLLDEFRPDVLHLHLPNPSVFWVLASARAKKVPWVLQWHSDVIAATWPMKMAYAAYRPFEKRLLSRAAAVVVSSQTYLEASAPLARYRDKCHVVPLGIDTARYSQYEQVAGMGQSGLQPLPQEDDNAARAGLGAASAATGGESEPGPNAVEQRHHRVGGPSGPTEESAAPEEPRPLRILAVGRLTYYKGFRYLLEALARVPGVRLQLVGQGDEAAMLRALAARLELGDRVRFAGGLDDAGLVQALRDCDCLCLPSIERTEAFGVVLLEAMYFGKP
ncbi:MAG: glycosyltransferase, partial [Xanthomonadales bacterium]